MFQTLALALTIFCIKLSAKLAIDTLAINVKYPHVISIPHSVIACLMFGRVGTRSSVRAFGSHCSELVGWFQSSLLLELSTPPSLMLEAHFVDGALDKKSGDFLALSSLRCFIFTKL